MIPVIYQLPASHEDLTSRGSPTKISLPRHVPSLNSPDPIGALGRRTVQAFAAFVRDA